MSRAAAILDLREALSRRFPDALPLAVRTVQAVATGIVHLDRLLPNGGLPRGRLTVWSPGGAATAVLRSACRSVVLGGERSAWVDGAGLVVGDFWPAGPLLLRPAGVPEALECAEELARSGGFGLVVLSADAGLDRVVVRLERAVRAGGGAFVALGREASVAQLRVHSRLVEESWSWQRDPFGEPVEAEAVVVQVEAWSLGWRGRTEFRLPVLGHRSRAAPETRLVDRRGADRGRAGDPRPGEGSW
jgi:hypothetical protein